MDIQIVKFDMYEMRKELNIHPYGDINRLIENVKKIIYLYRTLG